MKCLNCDKEAMGRSKYCSDSCKVLYNRKQSKAETVNTPEGLKKAINLPANYGQEDCECKHCQVNRKTGGKLTINHGKYKPFSLLAENEVNRVSLPGDVDYKG